MLGCEPRRAPSRQTAWARGLHCTCNAGAGNELRVPVGGDLILFVGVRKCGTSASLSEVLRHSLAQELPDEFWFTGYYKIVFYPETCFDQEEISEMEMTAV